MNKIQIEIIREMIHERRANLQELINIERRKLKIKNELSIPSVQAGDGLPSRAQIILQSIIPKMVEYNAIVEEFNKPIEEKIRKLDRKYNALWSCFEGVKEKIMIKLAFTKNTMDEVEEILKLLPSGID